jgi:hypothetical protein
MIVALACLQSAVLDHAEAPVNDEPSNTILIEAMRAFADRARAFQREQGLTYTLKVGKV